MLISHTKEQCADSGKRDFEISVSVELVGDCKPIRHMVLDTTDHVYSSTWFCYLDVAVRNSSQVNECVQAWNSKCIRGDIKELACCWVVSLGS